MSTSLADVKHAIDKAQEAFDSAVWSKAPVQQRSIILSRLARSLESRIDHFASLDSLQTGELFSMIMSIHSNLFYARTSRARNESTAWTTSRMVHFFLDLSSISYFLSISGCTNP